MARSNFRVTRPEISPGTTGLISGGKQINYQIRQFIDQLSKLSTEIIQLRQAIQQKDKKILRLKNLLQNYKKFFIEEMNYLELQQVRIALINQTYQKIENFIKDIDVQISNLNENSIDLTDATSIVPLRRILSRFLLQKDFYQRQAQKEFDNLDERITEHQHLIEKIKDDIESLSE